MKIKQIFSYIILLIIVILAVTFAAINAKTVEFNYYVGSTSASLSVLLVYALGIGIVLGLLALFFPYLKLKRENRSLKNKIKQAEKKLALPEVPKN